MKEQKSSKTIDIVSYANAVSREHKLTGSTCRLFVVIHNCMKTNCSCRFKTLTTILLLAECVSLTYVQCFKKLFHIMN